MCGYVITLKLFALPFDRHFLIVQQWPSYTYLLARTVAYFTYVLGETHKFCLVCLQVRAKEPFQFGGILANGCPNGEREIDHFIDFTPGVIEQISSVSRHVHV